MLVSQVFESAKLLYISVFGAGAGTDSVHYNKKTSCLPPAYTKTERKFNNKAVFLNPNKEPQEEELG